MNRPRESERDKKILEDIYECLKEFSYNATCYGVRRIFKWLQIKKGYKGGIHTIYRLYQEHNITLKPKKKRGPKSYKSKGRTKESAPDLVNRQFKSSKPNELWITDITEMMTLDGKLYLCSFRDCFDGSIRGYCMDDNMEASLCVRAFINACKADNARGMIVHSDNGSQFKSREFKETLKKYDATQSMGAVDTCADNARMESWHGTFKNEAIIPINTKNMRMNEVKTLIFRYIFIAIAIGLLYLIMVGLLWLTVICILII